MTGGFTVAMSVVGGSVSCMEDTAAELLATTCDALRSLAAMPQESMPDDAVVALVRDAEQAQRLLSAVQLLGAAEVTHRSRHELGDAGLARRLGYARPAHLLEHLTRESGSVLRTRMSVGARLRPREQLGAPVPPLRAALADAVRGGEVGLSAAAAIAGVLDSASRAASLERLDAAEAALVEEAGVQPADLVRDEAVLWRAALDPDGAEPRDELQRAQREFSMGRARADGMTRFGGWADPASAALLKAAIEDRIGPRVQPRFLSEADRAAGVGGAEGAGADPATDFPIDPRSRRQKSFDVLLGLVTAGLNADASGRGPTPRSHTTVLATVDHETLMNGHGPGWLDGMAEPVSAATIRRLACDGGFTRVFLGAQGDILALGSPERFFTLVQRQAMAARDGGCVWLGCTAPASWCDAHHVLEHSRGGKTHVDNGVLLCPAHHQLLHASDFVIELRDGRPWMLRPAFVDPTRTWIPLGAPRTREPLRRILRS